MVLSGKRVNEALSRVNVWLRSDLIFDDVLFLTLDEKGEVQVNCCRHELGFAGAYIFAVILDSS